MSRRFHLFALLFFLGVGAYWALSNSHESSPVSATPAEGSAGQPPALSPAEIQKQFEALEKDKEASLAKLGTREANAQLRERAAANTYQVREQQQFARQPAWAKVLAVNWPVYQKLHTQAAASSSGTVACTICDGRGKLDFCVMCNGSGKCQTCSGTGYMPNGEPCPNCLGDKKCYLCEGTGKMACPFCDDGEIYSKAGPPPNLLPIYCHPPATVVAGVSQPAPNADSTVLPQDALEKSKAPVNVEAFAPPSAFNRNTITMLTILTLSLLVGILGLVRGFNKRSETLAILARQAAENAQREKRIFEDPTMKTFFVELQLGLHASPTEFVPDAIALLQNTRQEVNATKLDLAAASETFYGSVLGNILRLRTLLSAVDRAKDKTQREKLLLEFSEDVRPAKVTCLVPALRSFWLLSFALEGFARQLSRNTSQATPSALRTLEGALDMLETLCTDDLRADLLSNPPIRLLAVDDNAVCLRSMSFALKKVFSEPDLAAEGKAALALINKHNYDVIFLDIDMPGLNGFEVCSKIREGQLNGHTPVVFVTQHSDFNSRAESVVVGGQDLIAKPYLPAEITVKTLMFAIRARLDSDAARAKALSENAEAHNTSDQHVDASEPVIVTPAPAQAG